MLNVIMLFSMLIIKYKNITLIEFPEQINQISHKIHVRRRHTEERSGERDPQAAAGAADALALHHAPQRGADQHGLAERLLQLHALQLELELRVTVRL